MSGWGWATCPNDGEPVISTLEFPKKEFICVVCGWLGGFLEPVPNKTDDLQARHDQLAEQYRAARKARQEASS